MFTLEEFEAIPNGEIIRDITTKYQNVVNVNDMALRFIVVKSESGADWCIYFGYSHHLVIYLLHYGDKVQSKENILSLFPCDEAVLSKYRY
jgi:Tfp pilus assembly ATPase PilU